MLNNKDVVFIHQTAFIQQKTFVGHECVSGTLQDAQNPKTAFCLQELTVEPGSQTAGLTGTSLRASSGGGQTGGRGQEEHRSLRTPRGSQMEMKTEKEGGCQHLGLGGEQDSVLGSSGHQSRRRRSRP